MRRILGNTLVGGQLATPGAVLGMAETHTLQRGFRAQLRTNTSRNTLAAASTEEPRNAFLSASLSPDSAHSWSKWIRLSSFLAAVTLLPSPRPASSTPRRLSTSPATHAVTREPQRVSFPTPSSSRQVISRNNDIINQTIMIVFLICSLASKQATFVKE